jgi:hypothetical protein
VNLVILQTRLAGIDIPAYFVGAPGREDLTWSMDLLGKLPDESGIEIFKQYLAKRKKGEAYNAYKANVWLRARVDWLASLLAAFPVDLHELRNEERRAEVAAEQANQSALILHEMTNFGTEQADTMDCYFQVGSVAKKWGFLPPLPANFPNDDARQLWVSSVLIRVLDPKWWERRISRAWDRYTEHGAILLGKVRKGVSAYMSEKNLQEHRNRKRAAALWMRDMLAVNPEHGYEISLEQAIMASPANPKIRRFELMARMRGFEDIATDNGYVGLFITWTAPSRFHSWKQASNGKAVENQKYSGVTPRETQQYLCRLWAKARAKLKRENIQPFGFRVCEPHHDGTPHWHMLLFVHPDQWATCISILQEYAITDDKEELLRRHTKQGRSCPPFTDITPRFDWKFIDASKGSATGYIAKYIAKNLDGHAVGLDDETGLPAETTATAVTGWASWWGIRQFQQIGGPSVTVWRELRRVRAIVGPPLDYQLETCRRAADVGNWRWYTDAMGGPVCCRADRPVRLLNIIKEAASKYGEDVTKMMGVMGWREQIETRLEGWEISKYGLEARGLVPLAARQGSAVAVDLGLGEAGAPWSSDNNCTEDQERIRLKELLDEMSRLGLDDWKQDRVIQGVVVKFAGQFVWLDHPTRELTVSQSHPLSRELNRMGLDDWTQDRVIQGAVVSFEGQFVWLGHQTKQLMISQSHPNAQDDDHVWLDCEANNRISDRVDQMRTEAIELVACGGDVEQWLEQLPYDYHETAIEQLGAAITAMEHANADID